MYKLQDYRTQSYKKYASERNKGSSKFKEGVVVEGYGQQAISGSGSDRIELIGKPVEKSVQKDSESVVVSEEISPKAVDLFKDKSVTSVPISGKLASKISQQSLREDNLYYVDVKKKRDEDKKSILKDSGQQYPEDVRNKLIRFTRKSIGETKESIKEGNPFKIEYGILKSTAGVGLTSSVIVAEELFGSQISFKNPDTGKFNIFVSPELLIGAAQLNPKQAFVSTKLGTASKLDIAASKSASEEFSVFKGKVFDAKVFKNYFDSWFDNSLLKKAEGYSETELAVISNERRLAAAKNLAKENPLSVEIKLRPIEDVRIVGGSKKLGGVETGAEYMIIRKGEAQFVNPKDIPEYQAIQLSGISREINAPLSNKVVTPSDELLSFRESVKKLPGGNLGSLSKDTRGYSDVSRSVKDIVSSDRFNELLNLKGASVKVDDFVSKVDVLDLENAKVFRKRFVQTIEGNQASSSFVDVKLNVNGVNFDKASNVRPGDSFSRLGYGKGNRYNANQIEDLRFNIGYVDKKQLVARNIRSVTEFESGFKVNLYTYDDSVRVFRNVDVFIPKAVNVGGRVGGVTSASEIVKRRSGEDVSGVGNFGGEQVSVLKTDTVKSNVDTLLKSELKKESKSEKVKIKREPEFDFKQGVGDNKFYPKVGGDFTPGRVVSSKLNDLVGSNSGRGGLFYARGKSSSLNNIGVAGGVDTRLSVRSGAGVGNIIKPSQSSDVSLIRATRQQQSSLSSSSSLSNFKFSSNYLNKDFDFSNRSRVNKRRKLDFDFNLNKDKSLFGVEVRRFGSFKQVGRGLNLGEAVELGKLKVGTSAAATFRVTKGGRPVEIPFNDKRFYGKGTEIIEKPKFRIKSSGELREITFKGIETQRRNRVGVLL